MTNLTLSDVDDFDLAALRQTLSAAGMDPGGMLRTRATESLDGHRAGEPVSMLVQLITDVDPNIVIAALSLWLLKRRTKTRKTEVIVETLPDGTQRTHTVKLDEATSGPPDAAIAEQVRSWLGDRRRPTEE